MKHKTQHTTHEQGQSLRNILYVWDTIHQNQEMVTLKIGKTLVGDSTVLNLTRGKAPPGLGRGHPPENKGAPPVSTTPYCNEYKHNHKFYKIKFLQSLNFTNMKKQILFLAFFVLAVFAGMNKSYGQEVDHLNALPTFCPTPVALTCGAGTALNPTPGVSYDYTITVNSSQSVHWFVTDEANVMTSSGTITTNVDPGDGLGDYILTSSAVYNNTSNTAVTIPITWKSFDGIANNVLLVAYVTNAAGCTDNIEVYRIEPKYSFTLDIAGILDAGTTGATECVAPVQSATYSAGTLTVDYGENYVFFTVNAANWQTSWETAFAATTDGTSTLGTPQWAYPDEANAGTAANWHDAGTAVDASHYTTIVDNGFIGKDGACIIIRVPVTHDVTESIADETINLVVNGEMINPQTTAYDGAYPDLDEPASGTDCASDLTTDNADFVITARPDINESAPSPFETKTPRD